MSFDRNEKAMVEYMSDLEMPWKGFFNKEHSGKLAEKFGVSGIPFLVVLDKNNRLVDSSGKGGNYRSPTVVLKDFGKLLSSSKFSR